MYVLNLCYHVFILLNYLFFFILVSSPMPALEIHVIYLLHLQMLYSMLLSQVLYDLLLLIIVILLAPALFFIPHRYQVLVLLDLLIFIPYKVFILFISLFFILALFFISLLAPILFIDYNMESHRVPLLLNFVHIIFILIYLAIIHVLASMLLLILSSILSYPLAAIRVLYVLLALIFVRLQSVGLVSTLG